MYLSLYLYENIKTKEYKKKTLTKRITLLIKHFIKQKRTNGFFLKALSSPY